MMDGIKNSNRLAALPVLIVDDEPQILKSFSVILRSSGVKDVICLEDSREVMSLLERQEVALIVMDLSMPHISGAKLLPDISQGYPHIPVIIMTAMNEIETAVASMQAGAFDYLVKPVELARFESSIKRALEVRSLRSEVSSLKRHLLHGALEHEDAFASIVTAGKSMRAICQYVEVIAGTQQPVLITGETGVGKELIARAVHAVSGRPGEFVAVNVAGLDDAMFSDTLFGHKKGAFTGAQETRDGLISQATGGTLFLDEIGDTSEVSQVKLLRLLQEQKYYPLGSDVPRASDVRIVVATNHDLSALIDKEAFRKDLYYRLRAHQIHIPSLRERLEDIPVLTGHFIRQASDTLGKKPPTAPQELYTLLAAYPFPGNVRELESMIFDAVARHQSGVLSMESFRAIIGSRAGFHGQAASGRAVNSSDPSKALPTLREAEAELISKALTTAGGNQGIAATLLGITRQALNKRLTRRKEKDADK
ncbi:MAG: sigma-54-dependent Fis family transcriptional regulator [Deltaproteobacteria bacterium]|nr:sigma-54-dependent Fis family transcriptional regulator [Deltaproteobacteria bacterium]